MHVRPAFPLLLVACSLLAGCVHAPTAPVHRPEPVVVLDIPATPATTVGPPPVRIAIIADLNGRYGATTYGPHVHAAVDRIVEMKPDIVLSAGDMVAGQKPGLDYPAMWAGFHRAVSDRLDEAGIPMAVAPGNHDASGYKKFAGEREVYREEWEARRPEVQFIDDSHYPFHYAFAVRDVLFIALDATTTTKLSASQHRWLRKVLERNRHYQTKVVFGHVPLHAFAEGKERNIMNDAALEDMLNEFHVSMVVSGHHQAYYPGRRGALRMVGTGCLGGGVRRVLGTDKPSVRTVVVAEADGHGIHSLEALTGETFDELVDRETLPESIGVAPHVIWRDDVPAGRYRARVTGRVASSSAPMEGVERVGPSVESGVHTLEADPRTVPEQHTKLSGHAVASLEDSLEDDVGLEPELRVLERRHDPRLAMESSGLFR